VPRGQAMSTGPGIPSGHLSIIEVAEMFVDAQSERRRLRSATASDGVQPCLGCKSKNTLHVASEKPLPYRCRSCKMYFSVPASMENERRKKLDKYEKLLLRRIRRAVKGPLHETPIVVDREGFEILSNLQEKGMAVVNDSPDDTAEGAIYRVRLTPKGWAFAI